MAVERNLFQIALRQFAKILQIGNSGHIGSFDSKWDEKPRFSCQKNSMAMASSMTVAIRKQKGQGLSWRR